MEEAVVTLLTTAAGAGITVLPTVAVNWGLHPQGAALPGLVLNLVADTQDYTQAGESGLRRASVQIDAYAADAGAVLRLGREINTVLSGHRGPATGGFLEGIFRTARRGPVREGGTNEPERPFRLSMDFDVNWRES
jgi:hypothetical protein